MEWILLKFMLNPISEINSIPMKKTALLLLISLFAFSFIHAQDAGRKFEKRYAWMTQLDKLEVDDISQEDLLKMVDTLTLDKDKLTSAEYGFVSYYLGNFEKRWLAIHGHQPVMTSPSTAICVEGLYCGHCVALAKHLITSVPGVEEILEINPVTGMIRYSFQQEVMPTIETDVREALINGLPEAEQYKVLWSHEKEAELEEMAKEGKSPQPHQGCPFHDKE